MEDEYPKGPPVDVDSVFDKLSAKGAHDYFCYLLDEDFIAPIIARSVGKIVADSANKTLIDIMENAENADDAGADLDLQRTLAQEFAAKLDFKNVDSGFKYNKYEETVKYIFSRLVKKLNDAQNYKSPRITLEESQKLIASADEKVEDYLGSKYDEFYEAENPGETADEQD